MSDKYEETEFSMIEAENQNGMDFSINELFNPAVEAEEEVTGEVVDGSFMKDLKKMEESLSYESSAFDIYGQPDADSSQTLKQEDTGLRTTMSNTKGTSRTLDRQLEPDVCYLIVDFKQESPYASPQEANFADYFGADFLQSRKSMLKPAEESLRLPPSRPSIQSNKTTTEAKEKEKKNRITHRSKSKSSRCSSSPNKKLFLKKGTGENESAKKKVSSRSSRKSLRKKKEFKEKRSPENQMKGTFHEYYGYGEKLPQVRNGKSKEKEKQKKRKVVLSQKSIKISIWLV